MHVHCPESIDTKWYEMIFTTTNLPIYICESDLFFKCPFCAQVWKLCLWRFQDFSWGVDARIVVMIANLAVQDTIHYGILFIAICPTRLETINSHSLIGKPYLVTVVCNVYRKKPSKLRNSSSPRSATGIYHINSSILNVTCALHMKMFYSRMHV